jgi:hypothetical protein
VIIWLVKTLHAWNSARGLLHTARRLYAAGKHILVRGLLNARAGHFQLWRKLRDGGAKGPSRLAMSRRSARRLRKSREAINVKICTEVHVCESLAEERDTLNEANFITKSTPAIWLCEDAGRLSYLSRSLGLNYEGVVKGAMGIQASDSQHVHIFTLVASHGARRCRTASRDIL